MSLCIVGHDHEKNRFKQNIIVIMNPVFELEYLPQTIWLLLVKPHVTFVVMF